MLDVNGSRYHLVLGRSDWLRRPNRDRRWEYDADRQGVRLQAEIFRFNRGNESPRDPALRRGAAQDAYGHRYWIDGESRQQIFVLWAAARSPELLFPQPQPLQHPPGPFRPAAPEPPRAAEPLAGLAVVADGYLVAGAPTTTSLLVFDLYSLDGGFLRVPLPAGTVPFDLEALPDGGLLVLDQQNSRTWRLNRGFRPQGQTQSPGEPLLFQPKEGDPRQAPGVAVPEAIALTPNTIALAPVNDRDFWALVATTDPGQPSRLQFYQDGTAVSFVDAEGSAADFLPLHTARLVDQLEDDLNLERIRAYDLVYGAAEGSDGQLFLVDESGSQAYSLQIFSETSPRLRLERRYYPLRRFTDTALIAAGAAAYYRQNQRWLPLRALPQPRYEIEAVVLLPILDGHEPGCTWHRLCLDACLPPDADIAVYARAADVADDLGGPTWSSQSRQPHPYHRSGSEVPYSHLWSEAERQQPHTGTWELLFQQVQGRYLELRLELRGNGRNTPLIRALRAHYPRFSYRQRYLPPVYQRDRVSATFLDQFLANPEGLFTTLEGAIAQAQFLLDPRTSSDADLDWLAGWLGLALDPAWHPYQRRLLLAQASYFCRRRGTPAGILQAVLLTVHPELGPAIFRDDVEHLCTTVRLVERFVTRHQSAVAAGDPTETSGEATAAALAHRFIVLLPTTVDDRTRNLVERIVALEKPAHTAFTVRQYWALFRVGEVRLGIDTVLGRGGRFETFHLGQSALAEGVLGIAFPYTLTTRTVIAR